jgi:hypothetical protein
MHYEPPAIEKHEPIEAFLTPIDGASSDLTDNAIN